MRWSVTPTSERYGETGAALKCQGVHLSDTGVCCRAGVVPFEVSSEMLLTMVHQNANEIITNSSCRRGA